MKFSDPSSRIAGISVQPVRAVPKWVMPVSLPHIGQGPRQDSDNHRVRQAIAPRDIPQPLTVPWAMQMRAISGEEPNRLVQTLTGAILGCGGWVLSRGANDSGGVNMLFEFERQTCVDIYSVLIAAGLELSQNGHTRFTELCQCTRLHPKDCGAEIASIDLEVQTFSDETAGGSITPQHS